MINKEFDILIIGGGIIGGSIAYELSKYDLNIAVLEKNPVLGDETSRANSGAIHGGFDPEPHKIEAKLNVQGNKLWPQKIFKHLEFPWAKIDSIVIAFNTEEEQHLKMLYERGLENKVPAKYMQIIPGDELRKREPNLSKEITKALVYNRSYAINPVLATRAFFGAAEQNKTSIFRNSEVTHIAFENETFVVKTKNKQTFKAKVIINAAGHWADEIAELAGYPDFKQTTRRGEYRILDRTESGIVNSIIFMVPTIHGKGVIVAPMLDGHILVGPTAEEDIPKSDTRLVTQAKFDFIGEIGKKIIPDLKIDKTIMTLAGSRPIDIATNDFVINHAIKNQRFINAAGMQSPAIASAPAIALEIAKLVKKTGIKMEVNKNFNPNYKVIY